MARFTQEASSKDMLAKTLYSILDDTWLVAPSMPYPQHALMVSREGGAMLMVLVEAKRPPEASDDGGIIGLDHGLLVRLAKIAMGKKSAPVPIAVMAWFPMLDESDPFPDGIDAVALHYGTDMSALAMAMLSNIETTSMPLGDIVDVVEKSLRSGPKAIPNSPAQPPNVTSSVVKVVLGHPMDSNNPILLLIAQGIRNEVGTSMVSYSGTAVSVPDLQGPSNLLPALLVVAAETWAAADMRLEGKGGFHVHLVSMPGKENSWTGFAVAGVEASVVLLVTLGVSAVLRSCRLSDGSIVLDSMLSRFARFMEVNGHAGVDVKNIRATIEEDDQY